MKASHTRILGTVLSAAFNAGLAYIKPEFWPAATAIFSLTLGALHIPRPGDAPSK